jgi:hypothetical protein
MATVEVYKRINAMWRGDWYEQHGFFTERHDPLPRLVRVMPRGVCGDPIGPPALQLCARRSRSLTRSACVSVIEEATS